MRQLTLYVVLTLAVSFGVVTAQSVGATPVPLLPGYTHRANEFGIDSARGDIWKPNGPSISYGMGPFEGYLAEQYARQFPTLPTIRVRTSPAHPFVVVLDEEHDAMIVSACRADFRAHNVKSRPDVAEVLTIVKMVENNTCR